MKRKLRLLGAILLLSWTSFSQTVTNNPTEYDSIVIIPHFIAVQIAEDLVRYDECKEVLSTSLDLLDIANEKMSKQELIISEAGQQYMFCQDQVEAQKQQIDIYKAGLSDLNNKNESLKKQRNIFGGVSAGAVLSAILLIFIK